MNVSYRPLNPMDYPFIKELLPLAITTDTTGIVASNTDNGEVLAIFVCQDWTPTSVQVHQTILNPMVLRHGYFEECAYYIFTLAGRLKMYGLVPDNNKKALSVNEKIGFKEIARLEDACDVGVDYILMELKRDECVYWKPASQKAA